jgi:hypothetical protein
LLERAYALAAPESPDAERFLANLTRLQTQVGVALYRDGSYDRAELAFEDAIKTAPANLEAQLAPFSA